MAELLSQGWPPTAAEWTAFWTMLLVVVAGGALLVAGGQLTEVRRQRRDEHRAYVLVTANADMDTHALEIVVENAGRSHAADVHIEFSEPLEAAHDSLENLDSESLWNPPLLPPGYSYRTVLDMSHERSETSLPMTFAATVSWRSPATDRDEILTETYTLDFQRFYDMRRWTINRERDRTEALKTIAKQVTSIASSLKSG